MLVISICWKSCWLFSTNKCLGILPMQWLSSPTLSCVPMVNCIIAQAFLEYCASLSHSNIKKKGRKNLKILRCQGWCIVYWHTLKFVAQTKLVGDSLRHNGVRVRIFFSNCATFSFKSFYYESDLSLHSYSQHCFNVEVSTWWPYHFQLHLWKWKICSVLFISMFFFFLRHRFSNYNRFFCSHD